MFPKALGEQTMTNPNDDSVGSADIHRDPLACRIGGSRSYAAGRAMSPKTVRQKCALLADLSQWLGVRRLPAEQAG